MADVRPLNQFLNATPLAVLTPRTTQANPRKSAEQNREALEKWLVSRGMNPHGYRTQK